MKDSRIVSFLPAATEMVYALGLGDQLAGVSHECDFPAPARSLPVVVRPALDFEKMSLREIDVAVSDRLRRGASLYQVDEQLLRQLAPTHILTQNLCQVCAPSGNEITQALHALPIVPEILWFTPKCLDDIHQNLRQLGAACGREDQAGEIISSHRNRRQKLSEVVRAASSRPRIFCLEWTDPYYCCGHWVPEMVELAGGQDALGRKGTDSVRISWTDIAKWSPEVLIIMPCGFGLEKAVGQTIELLRQPGWSDLPAVRNGRVFAVNANSYFARPGPRVIEGIELLAHLIHPELCGWDGPDNAFRQIPASAGLPPSSRSKRCPECGAIFPCGPESGKAGCWCGDLPPLSPPTPNRDCLCPECLAKAIARKVSDSDCGSHPPRQPICRRSLP